MRLVITAVVDREGAVGDHVGQNIGDRGEPALQHSARLALVDTRVVVVGFQAEVTRLGGERLGRWCAVADRTGLYFGWSWLGLAGLR